MEESLKTEWQGLWQNREGVYSGYTIAKKDIPPYAKLIVRYNRFYEKNSNKPRFVYTFAQKTAAEAITLQVDREEYLSLCDAEEMSGMRCFTDKQLQELINKIACDIGGERHYGEHMISDYVKGYGTETQVL